MSELIKREDVLREIQTSFDGGAFRWQDGQDLMDRINAIPAASPWHRVEDELPDTPRMVIAYVDQWHIFAAYHSSRGEWKQADGFTVIGVTHWMPIEPPKEGTHENRDYP